MRETFNSVADAITPWPLPDPGTTQDPDAKDRGTLCLIAVCIQWRAIARAGQGPYWDALGSEGIYQAFRDALLATAKHGHLSRPVEGSPFRPATWWPHHPRLPPQLTRPPAFPLRWGYAGRDGQVRARSPASPRTRTARDAR